MTKITPVHKLRPKTWYHKHSRDLITFTSPLIRKFCQFGVLGFRDSGSLSGIVAKHRNNHFIDCYVVSFTVIFPSCISYRLDIFALIILFGLKLQREYRSYLFHVRIWSQCCCKVSLYNTFILSCLILFKLAFPFPLTKLKRKIPPSHYLCHDGNNHQHVLLITWIF